MLRAELYLCMNEGKVIVSCYSVDRHIGDICRVKTVELIYWTRLNVTMHSLHQKCSSTYMCCSLRSYLRSAYILNHTECIQCIHCIRNAAVRTCVVLYEAISDQLIYWIRLNVYNAFIASEVQPYVQSYMCCSLRGYLRSIKKACSQPVKCRSESLCLISNRRAVYSYLCIHCSEVSRIRVKTQRTPNSVVFLFQLSKGLFSQDF
jgi:hypothetical protein